MEALRPGAKGRFQVALQAFKADVVLAPYEAVCSDANLQGIPWNLAIVDERKRMRSALSKTYTSIADMDIKHRLLLSNSHTSQVSLSLTRVVKAPSYFCNAQGAKVF